MFDLYQQITDRIIAELEKGRVPWHKPWHCSSGAISRVTGKPYSVLNQLLLLCLKVIYPFLFSYSFQQCKEHLIHLDQ